jgi:hypothetical protein
MSASNESMLTLVGKRMLSNILTMCALGLWMLGMKIHHLWAPIWHGSRPSWATPYILGTKPTVNHHFNISFEFKCNNLPISTFFDLEGGRNNANKNTTRATMRW